jgi:hypothetical protein
MPPGGPNPRAFTVHADDVTFRNFELSATQSMDINNCFGIGFCDDPAHNHGHRMRVIDMHIHNWCRCISKVDKTDEELTVPTTTHLDCLIDRLYAHTFRDYGLRLDYGMHRLVMRDSRVIGRLAGEVHTTNNALHGGIRWEDNSFVNCIFSVVDMIGFEATLGGYAN